VVWSRGALRASALDFDEAESAALVRRADLVDGAVGVVVVAEVERADDLVRVLHQSVVHLARQQDHLARREAVVAVGEERRRDRTVGAVLGRDFADEGRSQEDAAVEERSVVDGRDRHDGVGVGQRLAALHLVYALVRAADVHHLRCTSHSINQSPSTTLPRRVAKYGLWMQCDTDLFVRFSV